jgi:superfamily II DNA or RNA helicase
VRRYQQLAHDEIIDKLVKYGSTMLHASTSYGKTLISIYIIKTVGLRTIISCPSVAVREQWQKALEESNFLVSFGGDPDNNCDVYITSPTMLGKCRDLSLENYGFVIVDEVQSFAKESVTHSLLKTCPRFLLGCSATPDTKDGVDVTFPFYYGPVNTWVKKVLVKDFIAYQIETNLRCYALASENGSTSHMEVMKSYYSQKNFHRLISRVINKIGNRRCMVMFLREDYGAGLFRDYLDSKNYNNYTYYTANDRSYDLTKKILITTYQKCGYGINDPDLSVLIMVHDGSDVRQPSGRIRKDEDFYIVDFVHPRENQRKHARKREEILIEGGGEVIKLRHDELDVLNFD